VQASALPPLKTIPASRSDFRTVRPPPVHARLRNLARDGRKEARMRLWRMSATRTLEEASWQEKAGRWHYAGTAVLYVSRSPELAVLEARVHHRAGMDRYYMSSVNVPNSARIHTIELDDLPRDWRTRKALTRTLGTRWLEAGETPVLCMPSAVVPLAHNYLLNPAHPALRGRLRLRVEGPMRFDRRLVEPVSEA
jgi:RES domain-containing protein